MNEALENDDSRKALQTALVTTAEQYFQGDDRSIANVLSGESTAAQISKAMQDIGAAYELRFREIGRNLVDDEEVLQFMFDCIHVITVQNLTERYQSMHTQKVEAAARRAEEIHGALLGIIESFPALSPTRNMLASRYVEIGAATFGE